MKKGDVQGKIREVSSLEGVYVSILYGFELAVQCNPSSIPEEWGKLMGKSESGETGI